MGNNALKLYRINFFLTVGIGSLKKKKKPQTLDALIIKEKP